MPEPQSKKLAKPSTNMKIILLILLSTSAYAQVSVKFVERIIQRRSIVSDTLTRTALATSSGMNLQYLATGDYDITPSRNYELTTYMGSPQEVEVAIIEDRSYYSSSKSVFIYNNFDMLTGNNLLMVYTFP